MAVLKTRRIDSALKSKGFEKGQGNHRFYSFFYQGKKTHIHTKISHSHDEIGDELISRMADQLFLTKAEFKKLVNCPLKESGYIQILLSKNELPNMSSE